MKLRTLFITVAVLAILSGIVYFVQRPAAAPSTDPRVGQPLVDRPTVEKAQKIRLADQGKTVALARQSDGTWRVTSYYDLPADFQKLSRFIGELTDAKVDRFVTSNPERLARLEFKDTKIELLDSADKPLWSVTLGKTPDTGGRFLRFGDEPKAYLANLSTWLDTDAKNWADSQLINLKPEDIASIELPFADGPVTVSRAKKDEPWTADKTPAHEKLKEDKITSVLGSLDGIRFSDTVEPADPKVVEAKPHTRTFKLTTFGHKTYTIAFARKPEEKKLKPPAPSTDGKTGPAALGLVKDGKLTDAAKKPGDKKPLAPEFETIPAGPVFVHITSSDASAPVNALMTKRAFEVSDYIYTGLPEKASDLFEPAPPPPAPAKAAEKSTAPPAGGKK